MAKTSSKKGSGGYVFAAILIAIIYIFNTLLVENIYSSSAETSRKTGMSNSAINRMNGHLSDINKNSLSIAAGVGDPRALIAQTGPLYGNIIAAEKQFEAIGEVSPQLQRRFNYAKAIVDTYKNKLDAQGSSTAVGDDQQAKTDIMKYELYPLQVTASEMLTSCIEIVNIENTKMNAQNTTKSYILMTIMMLIAILGELAVWLFARRAKKARLELEEREMRLAEVDAKLKNTRQKASDLAVMNVLTGMATDSNQADSRSPYSIWITSEASTIPTAMTSVMSIFQQLLRDSSRSSQMLPRSTTSQVMSSALYSTRISQRARQQVSLRTSSV